MAKLVTDTEEAWEFFNHLGISRLAVTFTAIFIHKTHCYCNVRISFKFLLRKKQEN